MHVFLKSFAKKLGYLIASLIIIAAVFVCVIRMMTPILDEHRVDIEKIASQFLQTPVVIKKVRVSWYQYQPVIRLNSVTILNKETRAPVFHVKNVSIFISIAKSLWQWQFVTTGVMVSGAELNISQSAKGEYTVEEFSSLNFNHPNKSETKFTDVMGWLSQEPYLTLRDIDLYYSGFNGQKRFVTLYDLSFENSTANHKIIGNAVLHQDIPTNVSLGAQWTGNATDISQIKARGYVSVTDLSLPQWAKDSSYQGWQVKGGMASAKIWAVWEHGSFQKIQSIVESYDLKLFSASDKRTHQINRLSGNFGWKQEGKNQVFAGDDILIDLPKHLWPVTHFYLSLTPDANGALVPSSAKIGYIDIHDIQSFLFSIPELLSDSTKQSLSTLKLKGALQDAEMSFSGPWNDYKHISLHANFLGLGFTPSEHYPGIENLRGMIQWDGSQGELKIDSAKSVYLHNAAFNNDIPLDQLTGVLQIKNDDKNNWLLNLSSLNLLNSDIALNMSGTVAIPQNNSPIVDINANMSLLKASRITHYLPMKILDKEFAEWMQQAFVAGEIPSIHTVVRGSLADFPFDNGKGEVSATAKVKNIDLRYAPDWPLLRHVTGTVVFTGRKLTVDLDGADTLGIPLSKLHGVIPYLGDAQPQILQVTADKFSTDFQTAMHFVHSSPLEKNLGKMFAGIDLQGLIDLRLNLNVPLSHPDDTKVKGDIDIHDAVMNMAPWNLKLNHFGGLLQFTEDSAEAKNMQAELFNRPLQFNVSTKQVKAGKEKAGKEKNTSVIQASFNSNFNIADIENWLKLPISNTVKGSANINGVIGFSLTQPLEIHLKSNLVGATVDLVDQYGKNAKTARDFSADIFVQNDKPMRIKISYGKLFSTAAILERKLEKYNLIGADFRFGSGQADWPADPGIYISGEFDTLDWDKIKTYMDRPSGNNTALSDMKLKEIDIRVNKIILGAQSLTKARIQAEPDKNNWTVNINSSEIVGQIRAPINLNRQSLISAQLQRVNIRSTSNTKSSLPLDVTSLPAISLIANDVRYNNMPIGKINFNAVPIANGLSIKTLRITSPYLDLRAAGDWKKSSKGVMTRLQGRALSQKVSGLLNSFGVDARNFVSSNGSLDFNLYWADAPYAPALASMSGNASLAMGAGRIVDIGEQNNAKMDIGRMLSIFSLQTIPRRLTLDFSDVFQKGYSFDSLEGDFVIRNGDLNTNNLRFDGPVAKIGINGKIGLKNKNYNFILSVTAHVTSSIPVAAALLINPLVGVGALAVNEMIGSTVSGLITNYYLVTGPWNNPVWKSVKSATGR